MAEKLSSVSESSDSLSRLRSAILSIRRANIGTTYARDIQAAYQNEYVKRHKSQLSAFVRGATSTGLPVPILSVCGQGTREIRFTQLLRHFLDPSEPHGLGARLLKAAFEGILEQKDHRPLDVQEWADAEVEAEVSLGKTARPGGREHENMLDLLITVGDVAILIEQKIRSSENVDSFVDKESGQDLKIDTKQLPEYSEAWELIRTKIAPRAITVIKLFLTPEGKEPNCLGWDKLSHGDLINLLLNVDPAPLAPIARHNLLTFLWDLACGPIELKEKLRTEVPVLRNVMKNADENRLGPYLSWRRNSHLDMELLLEIFWRLNREET